MRICVIKILFLALTLAIASFAQKDLASILHQEIKKCEKDIMADSLTFFASIEPQLATLRKEIDSLDFQECYPDFKCDFKYFERIRRELSGKRSKCRAFTLSNHYLQQCYSSQDIDISAEITISEICTKTKRFLIKDKINGMEYDSIADPQSDWILADSSAKFLKYAMSRGLKREYFYDNQGFLTGEFIIKKNNDTVYSWLFFWEKDRLTKTILNWDGISEYIFTYGSPCDPVIVEPPDWLTESTITYHKSFGFIPEKGDPGYEGFKTHPYHYRASPVVKEPLYKEPPYHYRPAPELLERQKKRCEEYKKSQKKGKK